MSVKPYSVVSLFAGAGGLDVGLEQAGFSTVAAVDHDPDCLRTLRQNQLAQLSDGSGRSYLDQANLLLRGVEDLTLSDLRPASASPTWVPDLMAGGPPCQPFSSSGKMLSTDDPRGRLFEHFVRVAGLLKPKVILFENVRGLVTARGPSGEPGEVLRMVKSSFERIGYATNFALLNAADFGSPQRRIRCFLLATRCTALPEFPTPTHAECPGGGLFETLLPWVSLQDFLATRPAPSFAEFVRPSAKLEALLRDTPGGSGLKSAGAREATRPGGHWGYRQGTFVADLRQPARTVTGSASQDWLRLPDFSLRRLTLGECAGLQGFPDGWQFAGPVASRFKQVGNAVPSIFGRVLGRAITTALATSQRTRPESAPLPREFLSAVTYTKREQARNGASRVEVREKAQTLGAEIHKVKGYGSQKCASQKGSASQ